MVDLVYYDNKLQALHKEYGYTKEDVKKIDDFKRRADNIAYQRCLAISFNEVEKQEAICQEKKQ